VCDLETSRMGAPYIYDISRLRVNTVCIAIGICHTGYADRLIAGYNTRLLMMDSRPVRNM